MKMIFCTIIVVTMMDFSTTVNLTIPLLLALIAVIQIFFWLLQRRHCKLPERSLGNNHRIKMLFITLRSILYKIFLEKNLEFFLVVRKTSRFLLELLLSFQGSCPYKNLEKVETSSFCVCIAWTKNSSLRTTFPQRPGTTSIWKKLQNISKYIIRWNLPILPWIFKALSGDRMPILTNLLLLGILKTILVILPHLQLLFSLALLTSTVVLGSTVWPVSW